MAYSYTVDLTSEKFSSTKNVVVPKIEKKFEDKLRHALANIFAFTDEMMVVSDSSIDWLSVRLDSLLTTIAEKQINVFQKEEVYVVNEDISLLNHFLTDLIELYSVKYEITYAQLKDKLRVTILDKNAKYGDAALNPLTVFIQMSNADLIKIRMQDKLSRLKNKSDSDNEDALFDLIGYLVLLEIAEPFVEN
jgi:hypothetical protein